MSFLNNDENMDYDVLADGENAQTDTESELLLSINYDNTFAETEKAMKIFQGILNNKRNIAYSVAYAFIIAAAIFMIVTNSGRTYAIIALVMCVAFIINLWTTPIRVRAKVMKTIMGMKQEKYTASFYDDKIEIETVFEPRVDVIVPIDDDSDDANEKSDEAEEEDLSPAKTVYHYGIISIQTHKTDDMFLMCVGKRHIYCFPKRCLTDEQADKLNEILFLK